MSLLPFSVEKRQGKETRKLRLEDTNAWLANAIGCTGWRRPIGCLQLQVILWKRATNYRALLRKMTKKIRHSMGLSHPVSHSTMYTYTHMCRTHTYVQDTHICAWYTHGCTIHSCVYWYMYIYWYGVATISRPLNIICLSCKRAL